MRAVNDPGNSAAIRENNALYGHRISQLGASFVIARPAYSRDVQPRRPFLSVARREPQAG
jgi:hypothetical protein